ncbi:MAG TPA: glycosyltransferase family 2 protein [Rhizomicrobium sp.]|jgi:glycosyltransferase involved in cell wall biosynthesis|nr:glycosyltransferase family 2 protein [Rhizomicrobium sp.]
MNGHHEVSVVIPAYNSEATIARALESAIGQSRPPLEIIVVDDCSTDATREIVSEYASRSVRTIILPCRSGAGAARNAGIRAASGDLTAFLDSDDEWLPEKLEKQVAMIESDSRLYFVACASRLVSAAGTDLGDTYRGQPVVTGEEAWKALLACNFVATPTVLVWRRHVLTAGGFNEKMKIGEDQDLWIRLALAGPLGYVHENLVRVYMRENSLSSWALADLLTYTMPMVEGHLATLRGRLTPREIRRIRGERLNRFGRVAYTRGEFGNGFGLLARSMLLGYRPLESTLFMASASPPAMWLKRQLGLRASP